MNNNCGRCGKETKESEYYCPLCADGSDAAKPKKIWLFAVFFSVSLLVLAGMLLWHGNIGGWNFSWEALTGRPAATINGEKVSLHDLRVRLNAGRRMLEQQYGKDIFTGERGREFLKSLQRKVLDSMLEECLVAREAKRLDVIISDKKIEQELQRIAEEIYGSRENFHKRIAEDGISPEGLKNHIRHIMTVQALIKVKAAPAAADAQREVYFNVWLDQAKSKAQVTIHDSLLTIADASSRGGGCCGAEVPAGGCGGGKRSSPVDAETEKKAAVAALTAYKKINGDAKYLKAKISDYGCHIQVDIEIDGKIVNSYIYKDDQVFEI